MLHVALSCFTFPTFPLCRYTKNYIVIQQSHAGFIQYGEVWGVGEYGEGGSRGREEGYEDFEGEFKVTYFVHQFDRGSLI